MARRCSRTACSGPAVATLTYGYAEQTAVLGPLATYAEPHSYDLCAAHAARLSAPRGWDTVRLVDLDAGGDGGDTGAGAGEDDLLAVADAVSKNGRVQGRVPARPPSSQPHPAHATARAASGPTDAPSDRHSDRHADGPADGSGAVETGRRGHLRVLRDR